MAQAEQFMLRINTYGPDLLEGDTMPKYRELVEEVITPKFAADFEKNAPLAEATVKQAGLGAHRRGVQHRRLRDRLRLGHRAGGGLDHPVLPEEPRLRRAGARPTRRRSASRSRWSRSRAPGWSTTSRPLTGDADDAGTGAPHPAPAPRADRGGHAVTPTWYDLLGVEPDASADEIRAAWKAAHRRPRPRRPPVPHPQRGRRGAARPGPPSGVRRHAWSLKHEPAEPTSPRQPRRNGARRATRRRAGLANHDRDARSRPGCSPPSPSSAALLVAAAGYLVTQPSDDAIADATSDAQGAAERAATTILAYDYRHLDEDQKAAGALMTPAYQKKYDALFAQIAANAPDVKAIVTAEVVASGIVRSGDDRVQVLVFVNRPTLRNDTDRARRLPGPGRDDHGEVRRRLARRRHGHQPARRLSRSLRRRATGELRRVRAGQRRCGRVAASPVLRRSA